MRKLQILSIELKNYRQYRGTHTISLATNGSNNINVLEGENGSGKSNLLNAITFCLYDREDHLEESRKEGLNLYPIANRKMLEELDDGNEINGYIEIRFGRDQPEYRFKREFTTVKKGENTFSDASGDLTLQRKEGHNWEIKDDPNAHLNQILPVDVRDYYLFDGERLDTFFEEEYAEKVKKGIIDVSHIKLLNRAKDHLKNVRNDVQDKDDFSGREDELRDELQTKKEELGELEDDLEKINSNLTEIRHHIRAKESKLESSNDKYIRSKQEQRNNAKEELKSLQKEEDRLENKSGDVLSEAAPIVYTYDALEYTLDQIKALHKEGDIPPRIQDYFIRELLERGTCICGEEIEDRHEAELRGILRDVEESLDEEGNLEAKSEIPRIQDYGCDKVNELLDLRQKLKTNERNQTKKQTEINEIKEELKQYDTSDESIDVDVIESQLEKIEDRESTLESKKNTVLRKIGRKEDEVEEKDEELTKELSKKAKHQKLVAKLDFLENAITNVTNIRDAVLEEIRDEAENKVEQYFNQLIWKDEEYEVKFEDDYTIRVFDEFGTDKIGSLSAGEKQVLALSFMSALTSISGFEAPIVIDTPLGRISGEPRNRIAENIPVYMEDTQLTFLMTDSEYTTQVESRMKDSISNEYLLNSDGLETTVVAR